MAQTTINKPQNVFDEAAAYVQHMESFKKAESLALHHLETADAALLEARKRQASDAAQSLIDDGDLPASEVLPEEIRVNHCRTALLGVRRKIVEHDVHLPGLQQRLDATRADYNKKVVAEFMAKEYAPAATAYTAVLRRAAALGMALGEPLDPRQADGSLGSCFRVPAHGDWNNDPGASKLHAEHSGRKEASTKLQRYAHEAVARSKAAELQSRNRAIYNPEPGTKYVVIREFATADRVYRPGDVVDSFSFPQELLRLELGASRLMRQLPEDQI